MGIALNDRTRAQSDAAQQPATEAVASVALILNVAAIAAFALCLGAVGLADAGLAASWGIIAVCGFAASLVCFAVDSEAVQEQPEPVAVQQVRTSRPAIPPHLQGGVA
jgi:hypothetical protein